VITVPGPGVKRLPGRSGPLVFSPARESRRGCLLAAPVPPCYYCQLQHNGQTLAGFSWVPTPSEEGRVVHAGWHTPCASRCASFSPTYIALQDIKALRIWAQELLLHRVVIVVELWRVTRWNVTGQRTGMRYSVMLDDLSLEPVSLVVHFNDLK
jgi:hypothetical protein